MSDTDPFDAASSQWTARGLAHVPDIRAHRPALGGTRVYILHPYPVFRFGILSVLEDEPLLHCVGWAASLKDALVEAPVLNPDIVLADPGSGADGAATVQSLHRALPGTCLLLLCGDDALPLDSTLVRTGACQRVSRAAAPTELVRALKAAQAHAQGDLDALPTWDCAMGAEARRGRSRCAVDELGTDLTQRERLLLTHMARGLSNREIALQLHIAMPTVKFHVTNILSKLQVNNRTSAVLVALRHGLVAIN